MNFFDATKGIAVGYSGLFPVYGKILRSTDAGSSFSLAYSAEEDMELTDVHILDTQTGFVTGFGISSDYGVLYKTSDKGATWDTNRVFEENKLECVFFVDASVGYVGGGSGRSVVLKTTDGGESWTTVLDEGNLEDYTVHDIFFVDNNQDLQ